MERERTMGESVRIPRVKSRCTLPPPRFADKSHLIWRTMARRSSLVLQRRPSDAIVPPFLGMRTMDNADDYARMAMGHSSIDITFIAATT